MARRRMLKETVVKAIETRYNGHRFRSRTEARWAVLLNHLGVKYEYEPEGYDLGNGVRYLPDFYLPAEDIFLEIKGPEPTLAELHKAGMLAHHSDKDVYILQGAPGDHAVILLRGRFRATPEIVDWLDACPSGYVRGAIDHHLAGDLYIPHKAYETVPESEVALGSTNRPYKVWGARTFGWKDAHYDIDYDPAARRLCLWIATIASRHGREITDERYGLYTVAMDDCATEIYRVDIVTREELPGTFSPAIELSEEFQAGIAAAKSARFEFGENGAG